MALRRLRLWLRVSPYYAYHATVVGVVIGTAAALFEGHAFQPLLFGLTLGGALAAHTTAAFFNEYFDYALGADRRVDHSNPFAGGSRVILVRDGLRPSALLGAALAFAALGISLGLVLFVFRGLPVLLLGLAGYLFLFQYTAPPLKLAYRGWGEVVVGVSFGPLVVLGSAYIQAGVLSPRALAASLPLGLLVALVLLFNEFPDYGGDALVGKRNLVVRLGRDRAVHLCALFLFLITLSLLLPVLLSLFPLRALASLAAVASSVAALAILSRFRTSPEAMAPANALMLLNVLLLGGLLSWGLLA